MRGDGATVSRRSPERSSQEPVRDPARLDWHEVRKVAYYYLSVDELSYPFHIVKGLKTPSSAMPRTASPAMLAPEFEKVRRFMCK